jgi:hypothetical protein
MLGQVALQGIGQLQTGVGVRLRRQVTRHGGQRAKDAVRAGPRHPADSFGDQVRGVLSQIEDCVRVLRTIDRAVRIEGRLQQLHSDRPVRAEVAHQPQLTRVPSFRQGSAEHRPPVRPRGRGLNAGVLPGIDQQRPGVVHRFGRALEPQGPQGQVGPELLIIGQLPDCGQRPGPGRIWQLAVAVDQKPQIETGRGGRHRVFQQSPDNQADLSAIAGHPLQAKLHRMDQGRGLVSRFDRGDERSDRQRDPGQTRTIGAAQTPQRYFERWADAPAGRRLQNIDTRDEKSGMAFLELGGQLLEPGRVVLSERALEVDSDSLDRVPGHVCGQLLKAVPVDRQHEQVFGDRPVAGHPGPQPVVQAREIGFGAMDGEVPRDGVLGVGLVEEGVPPTDFLNGPFAEQLAESGHRFVGRDELDEAVAAGRPDRGCQCLGGADLVRCPVSPPATPVASNPAFPVGLVETRDGEAGRNSTRGRVEIASHGETQWRGEDITDA